MVTVGHQQSRVREPRLDLLELVGLRDRPDAVLLARVIDVLALRRARAHLATDLADRRRALGGPGGSVPG